MENQGGVTALPGENPAWTGEIRSDHLPAHALTFPVVSTKHGIVDIELRFATRDTATDDL